MKIVYVFSSLATVGGTERILTEKINYIIKHFGYDVTIITCYQPVNATNTFELSENVKQINIDIPYYLQYKHKYPKRLWVKWKSNRCLRKSISKIVQEINPDILIGVSRFKANYVSSIKCNAIKIIECHEVRYNTISDIGIKRSLPARIFLKIHEYFYFKTIERNANIVVTLTEQDKILWKKAKRIEVIPDFSTMQICHHSDVSSKRVIFAGRLEWEKGVGRLIEIWSIVCSKHPDWHLDIYGEGRMYNTLVALIKIYKARNLTIHKFTPNISQEFATSSICAVTSYFEGYSLVILESLKHGVPCVAFDCPFGPRSIIIDANCGFLVDNNDIRLFAERLCFLIENEQLRKDFSKAAIQQAKKFDVDIIMNKWKCLFENSLKEKDDKSIN